LYVGTMISASRATVAVAIPLPDRVT
jgi:hypothetical protein